MVQRIGEPQQCIEAQQRPGIHERLPEDSRRISSESGTAYADQRGRNARTSRSKVLMVRAVQCAQMAVLGSRGCRVDRTEDDQHRQRDRDAGPVVSPKPSMASIDKAYSGCRTTAYGPLRTSNWSLNPAMKTDVQMRPSVAQATQARPASCSASPTRPVAKSPLGNRHGDEQQREQARREAQSRRAA